MSIASRSIQLFAHGLMRCGNQPPFLDKNPLDDVNKTRSIRYVMQGGRCTTLKSLDEIWPRARKAEHFLRVRFDAPMSSYRCCLSITSTGT